MQEVPGAFPHQGSAPPLILARPAHVAVLLDREVWRKGLLLSLGRCGWRCGSGVKVVVFWCGPSPTPFTENSGTSSPVSPQARPAHGASAADDDDDDDDEGLGLLWDDGDQAQDTGGTGGLFDGPLTSEEGTGSSIVEEAEDCAEKEIYRCA